MLCGPFPSPARGNSPRTFRRPAWRRRARSRCFTLIELLVVVAIIGLLVSILVPALHNARAQSKRTKCQADLRTIGHAVQFYLNDNRDFFPDAPFYGCLGYVGRSMYHMVLGSQTPESRRPMNRYFNVEDNVLTEPNDKQVERKRNDLFECPADRGDSYFKLPGKYFIEHGTSYVYASDSREIDIPGQLPMVPAFGILSCRGLRLIEVKFTAKKVVFQEPVFNPMLDAKDDRSQWHYVGKAHGNLLFADGHVEFRFPQIFNPYADPNDAEPYY